MAPTGSQFAAQNLPMLQRQLYFSQLEGFAPSSPALALGCHLQNARQTHWRSKSAPEEVVLQQLMQRPPPHSRRPTRTPSFQVQGLPGLQTQQTKPVLLRRSKTNAADVAAGLQLHPSHGLPQRPPTKPLVHQWPAIEATVPKLPSASSNRLSFPSSATTSPVSSSSPQSMSSHHLLLRAKASSREDLMRPLYVDCSVEYDLGAHAKVPKGSAPLLIIHPAYQLQNSLQQLSKRERFHPYSLSEERSPQAEAGKSEVKLLPATATRPTNTRGGGLAASVGISRHQSFLLPSSTAANNRRSSLLFPRVYPHLDERATATTSHPQAGAAFLPNLYPRDPLLALSAVNIHQMEMPSRPDFLSNLNYKASNRRTSTSPSFHASMSSLLNLHPSSTSVQPVAPVDLSTVPGSCNDCLKSSSCGTSGIGSGAGSSMVVASEESHAAKNYSNDSGIGTPSASSSVIRAQPQPKPVLQLSQNDLQRTQEKTWKNNVSGFVNGFLCCTASSSSSNSSACGEASQTAMAAASHPFDHSGQASVTLSRISSGLSQAGSSSEIASESSLSSYSSPSISRSSSTLSGSAIRCPFCHATEEDCRDGFCNSIWKRELLRASALGQLRANGVTS